MNRDHEQKMAAAKDIAICSSKKQLEATLGRLKGNHGQPGEGCRPWCLPAAVLKPPSAASQLPAELPFL